MPADKHILIVDDDPLQCAHVRFLLEDCGQCRVSEAGSAGEALAELARGPVEAVVLDLEMPDTDGIQFIERMAEAHFFPSLLISSSHPLRVLESVVAMAREKGFPVLGAFAKPFTPEQAQLLHAYQPLPSRAHDPRQPAAFTAQTLRQALEQGEIQGWFQPKLSIAEGRIVAAEVLARWPRPGHGVVLPGDFLPAIGAAGLDRELLLRVLADGLAAHLRWRRSGHAISLGINLPVPLLRCEELPDQLHALVLEAGVEPSAISFELLEDDTLDELDRYYMGASRLRLKGFGLSQDDYGRGYSTLYNLISTPFTELKIDRAFVSGAWADEQRAAALVSAVKLGRDIGLTVTAEGVESPEDLDFLRRIGCDCAQGFLIGKALECERFAQMLQGQEAGR